MLVAQVPIYMYGIYSMGIFLIQGDSLTNSERVYSTLGFISIFVVVKQAFMIIVTKYMMSTMGGSQVLLIISIWLAMSTPFTFLYCWWASSYGKSVKQKKTYSEVPEGMF